jgi:phosphoribosyl-ATP pyrophosphohydrolase
MSSLEQQVRQFNTVYELELPESPRLPKDSEESDLIYRLINEELQETNEELDLADLGNGSLPALAKELTDILYVTAQRMVTLGLPVDALLREVQRSNLSKLGEDGKPVYREDGKVIKGPNYSPADIEGVLVAYCK